MVWIMETIIELVNVSKNFKSKKLYDNVSVKIKKGECVGFVGANGVGKSVLFQIMTGLLPIDKGEVYVNGSKLGELGMDFPKDVGILINEPGYIEYYSGYKNLLLLAQIQNIVDGDHIKEVMEMVGLDYSDNTPVKKYSMGMKQKLGIAQAIMENQQIIILDEPYNALDFQTNREITSLLVKLKNEGKTILLTSHQHEYLEKLCDKIYCIDEHRLVEFDEKLKEKYFGI